MNNTEYRWLNEASNTFLKRGYLLEGQTVDERVKIIANTAESILKIDGFADKLVDYIKRGWFSLSSPIWSNFGSTRGLPISCFGSNIEDNMESILFTNAEVGMMSKMGGGTAAYFSKLRPRGAAITDNGKSSGAVHFMQGFESTVNLISQGSTRRGNFAAYLDIDHDDIEEFLSIKSEGHPIQDISFAVCVSKAWLEDMKKGDADKRKIWAKVLQSRAEIGFPYLFFTDNANDNAADVYRDNNMKINHSNLCAEIMLPTNDEESFVCNLASMNILYFDEWKDTDAVETLTFLLDAVMTEFIEKSSKIAFLHKATAFAERHRAIGIGWLGYHSYLQSKMIPFESMEAKIANTLIAKTIFTKAYKASEKLAEMFGAPELLKNYGRRNSTLTAIAPTKSSAFILGQVSEGIQPDKSNYYIKDLAKIKYSIRNPYLTRLLEEKGQNTEQVWSSILANRGSVQHLDFLSDTEKAVFKTFVEISPKETVIQAAARQKFIDQGQSLNLMIHPSVPTKDVNALILFAEEQGIKSLYYQISVNAAQEFSSNILECSSCEA